MSRLIVLLIVFLSAGCSTSRSTFVSEETKTMKDIYNEKFNKAEGLSKADVSRPIRDAGDDLNPLVKREVKNLRSEFRYLPNPTLTMYIYPHLTDAGTPVPGYATFFTFYERDHIGLASEFDSSLVNNAEPTKNQ